MKYRSDFVTNSSSSSYIISIPKDFTITTTDKKLEYFIDILGKEFGDLFDLLERTNDDYGIKYYRTLEDIIKLCTDEGYRDYAVWIGELKKVVQSVNYHLHIIIP